VFFIRRGVSTFALNAAMSHLLRNSTHLFPGEAVLFLFP
jgi:hypothetical protein